MPYLVEVTGKHRTDKTLRVFRFTDAERGFNTGRTSSPPDAHYAPRVNNPGSYRRNLFGSTGRTNGSSEVDRGIVELNNNDGQLDQMRLYAFDGYPLVISRIDSRTSTYESRRSVTTATVEQIEFGIEAITLRLRSRLAVLDRPIQTQTFAGTTTDGTKKEAEGPVDLKEAPRPLLFGAPLNVPAILVNRFKQIYSVGEKLTLVLSVRDKGAKITYSGSDYPTVAALYDATISEGQYATCLALGLIRFGGNTGQNGSVTVNAVRGTTPARTCGQVVRMILKEYGGLVEDTDFLLSDISALDAVAPYEVGYWTGMNAGLTTLAVVSFILDSVGASISPDRNGVFRIRRLPATVGSPTRRFTRQDILEEGLQRLSTGDDGRGVPAKKVTVRHSRNYLVVTKDNLASTVIQNDKDFEAFATEEWRQESASTPGIAEVHQLAPEIEFQTALVKAADAQAVAAYRNACYGVYRDRYSVPLRGTAVDGVELADVAQIVLNRYGLSEGGGFVVIGSVEDLESNESKLDVWG